MQILETNMPAPTKAVKLFHFYKKPGFVETDDILKERVVKLFKLVNCPVTVVSAKRVDPKGSFSDVLRIELDSVEAVDVIMKMKMKFSIDGAESDNIKKVLIQLRKLKAGGKVMDIKPWFGSGGASVKHAEPVMDIP